MTPEGDRRPSPVEPLSVHTEPHPDGRVLTVRLGGEIDYASGGLLRERVISAAGQATPPRLVLDLDGVTFCDASGLGALVAIRNAVRTRHGDLVIARPPVLCRRILHCTGLDQHIHTTATLDCAITHLTR
ncbi:anti-sigma factor antagonist [Actinomadura sp. KC216]|uniref:STAS domain-containing protein n=1 Tax=Actinomadura sp. KC216 TaxID=2530370 RepID=UPI00104404FA|nr:STAS domain-containing protein [Actinomadura sp. KC216]TDB85057.1 anti-sigma factor antagonist [Actinomadura sp. KC216]